MKFLEAGDRAYSQGRVYNWPVLPILLPALLIYTLLYFIIPDSEMSLKTPPPENGIVENIQLALLGLATLLAMLAARKERDLVIYTTLFCLACITAASFLNEINSCKPPYSLKFCIPRWIKYPPFAVIIIIMTLKLINVSKSLKDIMPHLLHLRFIWPKIIVGLCFFASREAENSYSQYYEELIELFAMIFIATFSVYLYIGTKQTIDRI